MIVGAAAAHGIYSLSFLECWALSEGGYSLRVLDEIVRRGTVPLVDLEEQQKELRPGTDCAALASYFATVLQGLSTQARDGASMDELNAVIDLALAAWPAP